jgi:S1-C subfamily serine protease
VVSIDGFVVGLWDGSSIVSSDVIRDTMDLYFANNNNITRPLFGFDYSLVGKTQSGILDVSSGAQVTKLVKKDSSGHAMPGQAAGLLEGDIITQVGNNKISEDNGLEEALSKVKPGDLVSFTVERNKQVLVFTLTAGTLK